MSGVYDEKKDEDGFLYVTYSGENTFGNHFLPWLPFTIQAVISLTRLGLFHYADNSHCCSYLMYSINLCIVSFSRRCLNDGNNFLVIIKNNLIIILVHVCVVDSLLCFLFLLPKQASVTARNRVRRTGCFHPSPSKNQVLQTRWFMHMSATCCEWLEN